MLRWLIGAGCEALRPICRLWPAITLPRSSREYSADELRDPLREHFWDMDCEGFAGALAVALRRAPAGPAGVGVAVTPEVRNVLRYALLHGLGDRVRALDA